MSKLPKPMREAGELSRLGLGWAHRVLERASRDKPGPRPGPIADVWQWTGRKYRVRSAVLLLINVVLFFGLGCFTFWLRTGQLAPFATEGYWQSLWMAFDPTSENQVTLIDFLQHPIPVSQVPMMMVIVGLVLASLTAIPILVSMLYRFRYSLVFTAIIGLVAGLPWLALTVTFCCYLARCRPLQFSFRFATALISLSPIVVYYLSATRNASAVEYLPPIELAKLYMPWVLALIAACVVMAIVLLIARLVNYRPGAIAPLLAVLFVMPIILFRETVGRDELHYRLLEKHVLPGPRSSFASAVSEAELIQQAAQDLQENSAPVDIDPDRAIELVRSAWRIQAASGQAGLGDIARPIREAFDLDQYLAIQECERFISLFPNSRYAPNALYLKGRATDMRLDPDFSIVGGIIILRYTDRFFNAASLPTWADLHTDFPDSPLASVALYRHAMLEARTGNVKGAIELLTTLTERFANRGKDRTTNGQTGGWMAFLAKRPAQDSLDVEPAAVVQEGRKLLAFLVNNRVIDLEPYYKYPVLQRLLALNPLHPSYRRNLRELLAEITPTGPYSPTRLRDNIELLIVTTDPSWSRRISRLEPLIAEFASRPDCDALPVARFELGVAYQVDSRPDEARAMFETIQRKHADSPWAFEAGRRLATMGQPQERSTPGE